MRSMEPEGLQNAGGEQSAERGSAGQDSAGQDSAGRSAANPNSVAGPSSPADCGASLAPSQEPVLATIVDAPSKSAILRPRSAAQHPLPWNLETDLYVDPFVVGINYAKALFSREAQEALFAGRTLDKIYSVPRRFDLSTLFVVSTAFAMLFTLLGYLEFSAWAKLAWCFYFSGVGFAQAALYHGRAPRLASVLAGGLLLSLFIVPTTGSISNVVGAICLTFGTVIGGFPAGYIAGTLIGGVFLVADKLRTWIARQGVARGTS